MVCRWREQSVTDDTFYKGKKEFAGKPITKDTAKKVRTELDKVVNSEDSHAKTIKLMVMT